MRWLAITPASGRNWLLVAALSAALVIMVAVCVQQDSTIQAQQTLIRQLYKDSLSYQAMRMHQQPAQHQQ